MNFTDKHKIEGFCLANLKSFSGQCLNISTFFDQIKNKVKIIDSKEDSNLTYKCLDFCQQLVSLGQDFTISVTTTNGFKFKQKDSSVKEVRKSKKKPSSSTLNRKA